MSVACIIPTHERPALLRRAIASVLSQDLVPAVIIVAEDGSDPETAIVCHEFESNGLCPVVHVSSDSTRHTAGATRNAGLSFATDFDFVAFLDDDDEWLPAFLSTTVQLCEEQGADFSISWTNYVAGAWTGPGSRMPMDYSLRHGIALNPGFTGSNFVARNGVLTQVGGFDPELRVANDLDLLVRLLQAEFSYRVTQQPLVLQHIHGEGQLTVPNPARGRALREYGRKHAAILSKRDRSEIERLYHANMRRGGKLGARLWHAAAQLAHTQPSTLMAGALRRLKRMPEYGVDR